MLDGLFGSPAPPPFGERILHLAARDGYEIHRLVYAVLGKDGTRDFLFAPFPVDGSLYSVVTRPMDVAPDFQEGQHFRMVLRAMPSVKVNGKHRSIRRGPDGDGFRLRWIERRAVDRGFALLSAPTMTLEHMTVPKAATAFGLNICTYSAPIQITDPKTFGEAYATGIGQGRAWGCGMIILRAIEEDTR